MYLTFYVVVEFHLGVVLWSFTVCTLCRQLVGVAVCGHHFSPGVRGTAAAAPPPFRPGNPDLW